MSETPELQIETFATRTGWTFRYTLDGKTHTGPSYPTRDAAADAGLVHSGTSKSSQTRRGARPS